MIKKQVINLLNYTIMVNGTVVVRLGKDAKLIKPSNGTNFISFSGSHDIKKRIVDQATGHLKYVNEPQWLSFIYSAKDDLTKRASILRKGTMIEIAFKKITPRFYLKPDKSVIPYLELGIERWTDINILLSPKTEESEDANQPNLPANISNETESVESFETEEEEREACDLADEIVKRNTAKPARRRGTSAKKDKKS